MDVVDRFPLYPLLFTFAIFPLLAWAVLRVRGAVRMPLFAALNVGGLLLLCFLAAAKNVRLRNLVPYSRVVAIFFVAYVGLALVHYWLVRRCRREGWWATAAFLLPLVLLAYIKYAAEWLNPFGAVLAPAGLSRFALFFIGISYLAFRLMHLVQEVRNEVVEVPTVSEYLAFAFYVPTLSIGPINPYSRFIGSLRAPDRTATPVGESWLRIMTGFTKYIFLGSIAAQFGYDGLLRDGHPHGLGDLLLAVPLYAVYLYLNFSGYCDMVIGVSGLLGISVMENFDRPFLARNFQEFWTRWHISLSTWIRDLVFTPVSKGLMRRWGPKSANHAIAATILISFLLVGIWHGSGWNFVLFGLLQGLGLVTVHYYTAWLKKRLGREGFAAYRKNGWIKAVSTVMTFAYFSFTVFFLANTWRQMLALRGVLR